jgi:hypothetical protein
LLHLLFSLRKLFRRFFSGGAALYITKLPKAEHDAEEWLTAMEALLLVAQHDGPTMFARIGVMRALNYRQPVPTIAPLKGALVFGVCRYLRPRRK